MLNALICGTHDPEILAELARVLVAGALRHTMPGFLLNNREQASIAKFIGDNQNLTPWRCSASQNWASYAPVLYTAWHLCYTELMQREITQRELRNESGAIMRAIDGGESFVVTRNGVPVAEMTPVRRRKSTSRAAIVKAFKNAPSIDAKRFFADIDAILDQDPTIS